MKKNLFKLSFIFVFIVLFGIAGQAKAEEPVAIHISASTLSPFDGATTTISVSQFDPVAFGWIPASNATIDFGWDATTTDING